jgi:hypothetical protein
MASYGGDQSHTKGHMIEPMNRSRKRAAAVPPRSAAKQQHPPRDVPMPSLPIGRPTFNSTCQRDGTRLFVHGHPSALESAEMQEATGALLQAASGSHLGAVTWIRSHDYVVPSALTMGGGFPDASLLLPAGRVHPNAWYKEHACMLAGSRKIGRQRPLGARVACYVSSSGRALCNFFCARGRLGLMRETVPG